MEEQVSTGTAAAAELFAPFPPSTRDILILILIFFSLSKTKELENFQGQKPSIKQRQILPIGDKKI